MAIINPHDLPITCWPPSVRNTYTTFVEAEATGPLNGDIFYIGGELYWYDGADWQPMSCCPSCTVIPDTAFNDTLLPTTTEAQIWIDANATDATAGDLFVYAASPDPDWVWHMCQDGTVLRVESPSIEIHANVEIVDPSILNFTTNGSNTFTTCPGGTITDLAWVIEHGGVQVAAVNGAPAADATGETEIDAGTYETPRWASSIFDGTCGDLVVTLTATDSCGQTDAVTITVPEFGFVELVFLNDGSGGDDGVFNVSLNVNSSVPVWDMGDGTIITANNPAHTYASLGTYVATATVCAGDLLGISSLGADGDGLIGDFDSIFERTDLRLFTQLFQFRIQSNDGFHGTLPNLIDLPALTTLIVQNTSIIGDTPLLPVAIESVDLSSNLLDGIISSLDGLVNLTVWRADNNDLVGTLPSLATNVLLEVFTAVNNQLDGSIQDTTNNPALTRYEVENNLLTGTIPDVLSASNPLLERYNISRNDITGALPDLTGLTALTLYHIDRNLLTGPVASNYFATNTALTNVDASLNQITGFVPDVTGLTVLASYLWANNLLSGAVPSFAAAVALVNVSFSSNAGLTYAGGLITAANAAIATVNAQGNGFTPAEVDSIIIDTESAGTSNGTLNWTGDGPRTVASDVAHAALLVRLWTLLGV